MKKHSIIKNVSVLFISIMAVLCAKAQIYSGCITEDKHYAGKYSVYLKKIQSDFNRYIIQYNGVDTNYKKGYDKQYSTRVKDVLSSLNSIAESNVFNNYNVVYASDINAEYQKDSVFHIGFMEIHFTNDNEANEAYKHFYKKRKSYKLNEETVQEYKLIRKERILLVLHSEFVLDNRITNFINNYNF